MKIQGEDFDRIRALAIAGRDALAAAGLTLESYEQRDERIPRIGLARDVHMRWRWDCLWTGTKVHREFGLPCGYDDSHIDTVLRTVLK